MSVRQSILFSCVAFVAFFLLAELILMLFNIADPILREDPYVSFHASVPLYKKINSHKIQTVPGRTKYFNMQQFDAAKPDRTIRIFCFGGSTTYGRPYNATTAFPNIMEKSLRNLYPNHSFEVINTGGISYASYRIVKLVEEIIHYEPDIFLFYMGHNEFLEKRTFHNIIEDHTFVLSIHQFFLRFRFYHLLSRLIRKSPTTRLKSEVSAMLDTTEGLNAYHKDPEWRRGVLNQYAFNVKKIIALAQKQDIQIVFSTLPSNLKDFSPFKSEIDPEIPAHQLSALQADLVQIVMLMDKNKILEAEQRIADALARDPEYAMLYYYRGQIDYLKENFKESKDAFKQAKDLDVCPLRAPSEINRILNEITHEMQVPLIDMEEIFSDISVHGIPGHDLFLDHVHPTVQGHGIIAGHFISSMIASGILPSSMNNHPPVLQMTQSVTSNLVASLTPG